MAINFNENVFINNDDCEARLSKLYRYDSNQERGQKPIPAFGERIKEYEIKGLYKIFFDLAGDVYKEEIRSLTFSDRLEIIYKNFNEKLNDCNKSGSTWGKHVQKRNIDSKLFKALFLPAEEMLRGERLVERFLSAYEIMTESKDNNDCSINFRYDNAVRYLDSYLDLCRFVFKADCLKQEELRTLNIIESILNIDYNEKCGCFDLYSPFVVFAILRTLNYIAHLPENKDYSDLSDDCAQLLNSRKHIVATYAIRSFSRFTTINKKSYVVEYSRRMDKIICKEIEKVSSIDNVKPIRLFEKITSHIYNDFNESSEDSMSFTVSVYGFCAHTINNNYNPAEIDDLVYEIFSWFEDKKKYDAKMKDKKIDHLQLVYYLIQKDEPKSKTISSEYDYYFEGQSIESTPSCECSLKIEYNPYEFYNKNHLNKVIDRSNLVFILDCPWLAIEEFSLVNEGNLFSYYKKLNDVSVEDDLCVPSESSDSMFFNRTHLLSSINDQFNRLAVDNVAKHGKIVRILKDYMLKWIQQKIDNCKKFGDYKTVYVYNSSLRGMSFSDYADYPIIREESYSNKRFSIMRFSTRESNSVEFHKEIMNNKIYISLWNLVKYVDISFVYVGIKQYFEKCLFEFMRSIDDEVKLENVENKKKTLIKRDIISIMRNIVFCVEYSPNSFGQLNEVKINIMLSEPVQNAYKECTESFFRNNVLNLIKFFTNIITKVIFENSDGLADDCIRDAFERCLYNQSKAIDDIFFLHTYSRKRVSKSLNSFKVQVFYDDLESPNNLLTDVLVPNFDAFSDKRAYQKLFDYLDMPESQEFSVNSVLNQVDLIFSSNDNGWFKHSREILRNIYFICKKYNYTQSFLFENLHLFI